jgi:transcriptional regulator with XRE-family HTH domain
MAPFGSYVREVRERRRLSDPAYSLRRVAERLDIEPAYLSKIERGDLPPPSEAVVIGLAAELGEDADVLLAMAGKVSRDLQAIIRRRPREFAQLIRQLKDAPEHALLRIVREVRDGTW